MSPTRGRGVSRELPAPGELFVYAIVGLALHAFIQWLTGLIVAMRVDDAAARGRASTP